jgi:putative membrane protein
VNVQALPPINAALNATSTVLLIAAFILIKRRNYRGHAYMILSALVTSTAFLVCYIIYHAIAGEKTSGLKPGTLRTIYFCILAPHVILAVVMLPFICTALWHAYKRNWAVHRKIATPTYFAWLYVSVTGVLIYVMLYHVFPRVAAGG